MKGDLDATMLGANSLPSGPPNYSRRKVTPAQGDEIRRRFADGETAPSLAAEFGVTRSTIRFYAGSRRGY